MKPRDAHWEVKGYGRMGVLLLHTWHTSEASKNVEVEAWRARIRRGEATRCEVLSFGKTETIYE